MVSIKSVPVEFYGCTAMAFLETGYSILDSFYVIPYSNPWKAFKLSGACTAIYKYIDHKDIYAIVRPSSYFRFDVYDDSLGLGIFAGYNFYTALERWATDTAHSCIIGYQRSNQDISAECIVSGTAIPANAVSEYIHDVMKNLKK